MQHVRRTVGRGAFPPAVLQIPLIALLTVLLAGLLPAPCRGVTGEIGIVVTDKLSLRKRPTVNSPRLAILRENTTVTILAHTDGWVEVSQDGRTGYLRNLPRYIKIQRPKKVDIPTGGDAADLAAANKQIAAEIEASRVAVKDMTRKESDIIDLLDGIDAALDAARRKIDGYREEIRILDQHLLTAENRYDDLQRQADANRRIMEKRLVSLYKLGWLGTLNVLGSADSVYALIRRQDALERILAQDKALLAELHAQQQELTRLRDRIAAQKSEKEVLADEREQEVAKAAKEKARREVVLAEIRSRKSLELAAINMLKQAAENLDRTIKEIASRPPPPPPAPPKPSPSPEPSAPPVPPEAGGPPFSQLKGLLPMPVDGKIVTHFGKYTDSRYNVVNFRSGIDIQADRGEPVRAVHGGRVIFSNWFKGYGNMLILDHDDGYYSVYAHAEELFKNKGDRVEAEEVIATVGQTGSLTGPGLYFEVRHHGSPMNPLQWITGG